MKFALRLRILLSGLLVFLGFSVGCQQPLRQPPPGWQRAQFQDLSWMVRGTASQGDSRPGFAMQLFVDQSDQLVCQIGLIDLTAAEKEQALRNPDAFLAKAFSRYFQSLKGARRLSDLKATHHWPGREFLWIMPRGDAVIEGRTRIYLRKGSDQAIFHALMYDRSRRNVPVLRAYFEALEEKK